MEEASSTVDDDAVEMNGNEGDSYHGSMMLDDGRQRRRTENMGQSTPIRAAILDGRVGEMQTASADADDGAGVGSGASIEGEMEAAALDGRVEESDDARADEDDNKIATDGIGARVRARAQA